MAQTPRALKLPGGLVKVFLRSLLVLMSIAGSLFAQEPAITPDTPVDQAMIRKWLHSTDPRLIAWGADFARRRHDTEVIAEMPAMLEHWTFPPEYDRDDAQEAQYRAVLAVLDALIQEKVEVPAKAIKALTPSFVGQAATLIARLPLSASRATLEDWNYGAEGSPSERTRARIASMMIAKDPAGSRGWWDRNQIGFVASVLDASEMDVQISVQSDKSSIYGVGGDTCGDSFGHALAPGWPQVYLYTLDEVNNGKAEGPVIVDIEGDQIVWHRRAENVGWGSCGRGVEWLNSSTRHRLIAYWLGIPERKMSWSPVEPITIPWSDQSTYERQLGKIVEAERRKLNDTVESLRHRNLLKENESAMPRMIVTIQCAMSPCPL